LQATNNTTNFHTNLHLNTHCTKTGATGSGTSPGESSTYLANNPVGGVTSIENSLSGASKVGVALSEYTDSISGHKTPISYNASSPDKYPFNTPADHEHRTANEISSDLIVHPAEYSDVGSHNIGVVKFVINTSVGTLDFPNNIVKVDAGKFTRL